METTNRPLIVQLKTGTSYKVLQISGQAGMIMPSHYSTKEVVLIIMEGVALLVIDQKEHLLKKDDAFIIPPNQNHQLLLQSEFKGIAVMPINATILFNVENQD